MHEHENSHVKGTTITIKSGNDTTFKGAVFEGYSVKADIGGDLTIITQLDSGKAKQNNFGGGIKVDGGMIFTEDQQEIPYKDMVKEIGKGNYLGFDGGDGSFNWTFQNGNLSYEGTTEQSGIKTGSGGFDITVKGKTKLEGVLISGLNDETKNSLTTGTLETTDLDIHSDSSGMTLGGGGSFSVGDKNAVDDKGKKVAERGETSATSKLPVYEDNDKDRKITSGISKGEITITNPDDQKQDINTINRDTTNTLTELSALADLNDMLAKQKQKQADYDKLVSDINNNVANVMKGASKLSKILPEDWRPKYNEFWKDNGKGEQISKIIATALLNKDDPTQAVLMILGNDDPKYLIPQVGPIVESVVKATNGGDTQAGKLITQSISQQIIYSLAGSVGLDIAAKYTYENARN